MSGPAMERLLDAILALLTVFGDGEYDILCRVAQANTLGSGSMCFHPKTLLVEKPAGTRPTILSSNSQI
jgi:hypothetical protein